MQAYKDKLDQKEEIIEILKTGDTSSFNRIFWYVHTKPQFFWLENCDLKNITVIKYTKENFL